MTFGNHRQRVPRELVKEIKSVFGYLLKKIRQFSRLYRLSDYREAFKCNLLYQSTSKKPKSTKHESLVLCVIDSRAKFIFNVFSK